MLQTPDSRLRWSKREQTHLYIGAMVDMEQAIQSRLIQLGERNPKEPEMSRHIHPGRPPSSSREVLHLLINTILTSRESNGSIISPNRICTNGYLRPYVQRLQRARLA